MTFIESSKYVALGFVGMALFGMSINEAFSNQDGMHCLVSEEAPVMVCSHVPSGKADRWCVEVATLGGDRHFICTSDYAVFKSTLSKLVEREKILQEYDGMPGSEISIHKRLQRF